MPSSVIAHMSYDAVTQVLSVVFVSGSIYHYLAVPEQEYQAMNAAFSKGIYFNNHIKRKYRFRKIK
jgi:succinate dehydrogenase hydrophobic anchor subunit